MNKPSLLGVLGPCGPDHISQVQPVHGSRHGPKDSPRLPSGPERFVGVTVRGFWTQPWKEMLAGIRASRHSARWCKQKPALLYSLCSMLPGVTPICFRINVASSRRAFQSPRLGKFPLSYISTEPCASLSQCLSAC